MSASRNFGIACKPSVLSNPRLGGHSDLETEPLSSSPFSSSSHCLGGDSALQASAVMWIGLSELFGIECAPESGIPLASSGY